MKVELLPIGSVVTLKGGSSEIVVLGWYPTIPDDKELHISDYVGTNLPLGIHSGNIFNFDAADIARLLHTGYESEVTLKFKKEITEWYSENKSVFKQHLDK
ncbi:DUF4176 domain-containing protein [Lactococcus ileimucosae]|uniref:DUF4176 domain-containing protein n=1 Tax=Lactococcus ileimucosae TaxID=2941329 RepID=UPI0020439AE1|nr:DUF4176 domain-containing protein [Lactococcus ileimucosae]